jgi:hypothetical protein
MSPAARASGLSILTAILNTATQLGNLASSIQQTQQQSSTYNQTVIAPHTGLSTTRGFLATIQSSYNSWMNPVEALRVNSSTLAQTQALEGAMLSGASGTAIQPRYVQVYGTLPATTAVSPPLRAQMDMSDATANAALALAGNADQTSSTLLTTAQTLEKQSSSTAPGTAAIVEAEAQVLQLQGRAMEHRLLASLLRQRAARLAGRSAAIKDAAMQQQNFTQTTRNLPGGLQ